MENNEPKEGPSGFGPKPLKVTNDINQNTEDGDPPQSEVDSDSGSVQEENVNGASGTGAQINQFTAQSNLERSSIWTDGDPINKLTNQDKDESQRSDAGIGLGTQNAYGTVESFSDLLNVNNVTGQLNEANTGPGAGAVLGQLNTKINEDENAIESVPPADKDKGGKDEEDPKPEV